MEQTIHEYAKEHGSDEASYDSIKEAVLFGISLASKWHKVEDKLPQADEEVLCMMKSNDAIVSGFIYKEGDKYKVATTPDFYFEDWENYECTHWAYYETPY